jgi:hypothetical protein
MFEAYLAGLLNRFCSHLISDVDQDQLQVLIWEGELQLHDVQLQSELFDNIDIPASLLYGTP